MRSYLNVSSLRFIYLILRGKKHSYPSQMLNRYNNQKKSMLWDPMCAKGPPSLVFNHSSHVNTRFPHQHHTLGPHYCIWSVVPSPWHGIRSPHLNPPPPLMWMPSVRDLASHNGDSRGWQMVPDEDQPNRNFQLHYVSLTFGQQESPCCFIPRSSAWALEHMTYSFVSSMNTIPPLIDWRYRDIKHVYTYIYIYAYIYFIIACYIACYIMR